MSFRVKVRCSVIKEVITDDTCTEAQAGASPFDYAVDELECDMVDYDVLSVEPNE